MKNRLSPLYPVSHTEMGVDGKPIPFDERRRLAGLNIDEGMVMVMLNGPVSVQSYMQSDGRIDYRHFIQAEVTLSCGAVMKVRYQVAPDFELQGSGSSFMPFFICLTSGRHYSRGDKS